MVYFKQSTSLFAVKDDVNKRVNSAFINEGIEIPFNYVNVVMKEENEPVTVTFPSAPGISLIISPT